MCALLHLDRYISKLLKAIELIEVKLSLTLIRNESATFPRICIFNNSLFHLSRLSDKCDRPTLGHHLYLPQATMLATTAGKWRLFQP
jgi:hypothetical protein